MNGQLIYYEESWTTCETCGEPILSDQKVWVGAGGTKMYHAGCQPHG